MSLPNDSQTPSDQHVWSVSKLNRLARDSLEKVFSGIQVEGEIADLIQHRSGHWYFTLKDQDAQIRTAMFRFQNRQVRFNPENGQQVLLTGKLSIYEARGSFQLIADRMEPAGLGKLQQEFEVLKQRLSDEGLFDTTSKRPLPDFPRQIVIITSPQGAAIKDMQTTFARRFGGIQLYLIPVPVQGTGAAQQIAAAIDLANQWAQNNQYEPTLEDVTPETLCPDAIIIGRGGGSLEDLWAFNEADVAYAIHRSQIPVVSAVGHETDVTISDFVADVRAPTPTAAAEILSPDQQGMQQRLANLTSRVLTNMLYRLEHAQIRLDGLATRVRHPAHRLSQAAQTLDQLDNALYRAIIQKLADNSALVERYQTRLYNCSPDTAINHQKQTLKHLEKQLNHAIENTLNASKLRWQRVSEALNIVSPLATLQRGYAIVSDQHGEIIRDNKSVVIGEKVTARLGRGELLCTVEESQR